MTRSKYVPRPLRAASGRDRASRHRQKPPRVCRRRKMPAPRPYRRRHRAASSRHDVRVGRHRQIDRFVECGGALCKQQGERYDSRAIRHFTHQQTPSNGSRSRIERRQGVTHLCAGDFQQAIEWLVQIENKENRCGHRYRHSNMITAASILEPRQANQRSRISRSARTPI